MNPALYYLRRGDVARRHVCFLSWWWFLSPKGRKNYEQQIAGVLLDCFRGLHPARGLRPVGVG